MAYTDVLKRDSGAAWTAFKARAGRVARAVYEALKAAQEARAKRIIESYHTGERFL